jgi:hypothetical protein
MKDVVYVSTFGLAFLAGMALFLIVGWSLWDDQHPVLAVIHFCELTGLAWIALIKNHEVGQLRLALERTRLELRALQNP